MIGQGVAADPAIRQQWQRTQCEARLLDLLIGELAAGELDLRGQFATAGCVLSWQVAIDIL